MDRAADAIKTALGNVASFVIFTDKELAQLAAIAEVAEHGAYAEATRLVVALHNDLSDRLGDAHEVTEWIRRIFRYSDARRDDTGSVTYWQSLETGKYVAHPSKRRSQRARDHDMSDQLADVDDADTDTSWTRHNLAGGYSEHRRLNGKLLVIHRTPNGTYTATVADTYLGWARSINKAKGMAERKAVHDG